MPPPRNPFLRREPEAKPTKVQAEMRKNFAYKDNVLTATENFASCYLTNGKDEISGHHIYLIEAPVLKGLLTVYIDIKPYKWIYHPTTGLTEFTEEGGWDRKIMAGMSRPVINSNQSQYSGLLMREGDKLRIEVLDTGEVSFFINGNAMGTAFTGVKMLSPDRMYVSLTKSGDQVRILDN